MDYSDYISFLTDKGCSVKTIEDYGNTYRRFFSRFSALNEKNIRAFLADVKPSSKTTYRSQLKALCDYFDIAVDWVRKVPSIKIERTAPLVISSDHQRQILKFLSARYPSKNFADIYRFQIETGLRASELAALQPNDIEDVRVGRETRRCAKIVKGKGNKSRFVPLSAKAQKIIDQLGLPLQFERRRLNDAIVQARTDLKLPSYKPHTARKTFMTRNLARGVNVVNLAQIMGHENIKTMLIYADRSSETVADAFFKPGFIKEQ